MNQTLKDQFFKAIVLGLKRGAGKPIEMVSEFVLAGVELLYDMQHQDEGIGSVPEGWDYLNNSPAAAAPPAQPKPKIELAAPPPNPRSVQPLERREPSLILMPGDTEFTAPPDVKVRALALRRPTQAPSAARQAVQHWSQSELIETLIKGTPDHIMVDTFDREGRPRSLRLDQKVLNQEGLGNVILTYKHESVPDEHGLLVVKESISLNDRELDLEAVMQRIRQNAAGQYKARPETMEPRAGADPGPLRHNTGSGMGDIRDTVSINADYGARVSEEEVVQYQNNFRRQLVSDNRSLVPKSAPLKQG